MWNRIQVSDSNWEEVEKEVYRNKPLEDIPLRDKLATNEATLLEYNIIRNAEIEFKIKILSKSPSIHAAILFRKNGDYYLGAGVGGWGSKYSLMARTKNRIIGFPIGLESSIKINEDYNFKVRFESGHITKFNCNNEDLIIDNFSIMDSLGVGFTSGNIGLYAWDKTESELSLNVKVLPNIGFIITNIDTEKGTRKKYFENILKQNQIDCELIDARDLTNELPLMAKIKEGIIRSDFVISDFGFDNPRPNVYYETGISHSLGIPTIHIGPSPDDFDDVIPSDLKAQFFILEGDVEKNLPITIKKVLENKSSIFKYIG